jgi:flagellar hook-associated protein 2
MGSIISSGVGSGLDIAGIVQKLVAAEGGPKTLRLDTEEAKAQAKLSALGSLRSALATFSDTVAVLKNADEFQGRRVTQSTPDFIAASATSSAVPGSYSIRVAALAQAHKLQSEPLPATEAVGTGTLTITIDGEGFELAIDATNNTPAGIASAINGSAVRDKVVATVITGVDGAVLTLSTRATGVEHAIQIAQSGDAGLAAFAAGLTTVQDAEDARAFVDDIEVTSPTNTLSGAIAGVDIELLALNAEDETTDLAVGYDRAAARKTIDDFVNSYNGVVDAVRAVASYNAETRQGGPLSGDAGVRNIVYQLRRELGSAVSGLGGSFDMLNEIGVTAQLDGKLAVDATKLDAAFTADFDAIGELFAADEVGIAVKLDRLLQPYLQTDGVFDTRSATLKSSIEDIGDRRETLNQRLEALQARYLKQFNALDGLLARLQSTSDFLSRQLSSLSDISLFNKD